MTKKRDSTKMQTYLDHFYSLDYKERPVSVDRFLDDPHFLGNSTSKGQDVYDVWRKYFDALWDRVSSQ